MITINQAQFFASLQLTQAYCEQQLKYEKPDWIVLRSIISPAFEDGNWHANLPTYGVNAADWQAILWDDWTKKSDPYYFNSFTDIFNGQLEFKRMALGKSQYREGYRGKILVVEYGENIPDGAAEPETGGFFDEWDLPPIDTWFYNNHNADRGGILFAWIPEKFIELANMAIDVQFLDILKWFKKPNDWKK